MSDRTTREGQLARIRALMAKTVDNGCTEAEAAAAAAAVDRLLAQYEISLDEVNIREQEIVMRGVKARRHQVVDIAWHIAKFTDCKVWTSGDEIIYFGFVVDTEIAEYLTLVFKRAIDSGSAAFTLFNRDYDEASTPARVEMVRSFGIGMSHRLGERLMQLKSKRDFEQRESTGRDLVMLKHPFVDAAFDALNLTLGKGGPGSAPPRNRAAFAAGHKVADQVAINQGIAARAQRSEMIR
jgi:hypothetical protein